MSLIYATFCLLLSMTAAEAASTIDFSSLGRTFDGVGALSGGGGVTRLLIDYDPSITADILDIFFKPFAGASLQFIKVEMGGDTQSTEGTEQSHEHVRGDLNCSRGYEWWVVDEAKKRNPDIMTYGLSWGVPGWIGNGTYYSEDNLQYHVDWITCARQEHGWDVDYMGIWNERTQNDDWVIQLRQTLDYAGYNQTKIVYADTVWDVVDDLTANETLLEAVDVVGTHYPGVPPANAQTIGRPLWASESWDLNQVGDWAGAVSLASMLNDHALQNITASIIWCLIYSWPAILPFSVVDDTVQGAGHALLFAAEPWSGHYDVTPPVYIVAHTTQFMQPGWTYLQMGSGLGTLPQGGTFKTAINASTIAANQIAQWSIVIETMSATVAQEVDFAVTGLEPSLMPPYLHVWETTETSYFQKLLDIPVDDNGVFTIQLQPQAVYSVTTTTGQSFVTSHSIAPSAPFLLPYSDDFESYLEGAYPKYSNDEGGVFVTQALPTPNGGKGIYQVITEIPISWEPNPEPYTLLGNFNTGNGSWTDYVVAIDAAIASGGILPPNPTPGYHYAVVVNPCQAGSASQQFRQKADGTLESVALVGYCVGIDGTDEAVYNSPQLGLVPCGSDSVIAWNVVEDGNRLVENGTGQCADVAGASTAAGTNIITWPCKAYTGEPDNESWKISTNGDVVIISSLMDGYCLDYSEVFVQPAGLVKVCSRINSYTRGGPPPNGYCLFVYDGTGLDTSPWTLQFGTTVLASGNLTISMVPDGGLHNLAVAAQGANITASFDNVALISVIDNSSGYGMIAFGSGWHHAWFDNLAIKPL